MKKSLAISWEEDFKLNLAQGKVVRSRTSVKVLNKGYTKSPRTKDFSNSPHSRDIQIVLGPRALVVVLGPKALVKVLGPRALGISLTRGL